jgi:hypothetical protein
MSGFSSIHEVAESEINEVADFYDLESPGLGKLNQYPASRPGRAPLIPYPGFRVLIGVKPIT